MALAETIVTPTETHFTEGEPDLEPPEELAVAELDEQTMLEEELDNDDLREEDVDEDALEAALDDLVHSGDRAGDAGAAGATLVDRDALGDDDPPVDDDREEPLDAVLLERLDLLDEDGALYRSGALDRDGTEGDTVGIVELVALPGDLLELEDVIPCQSGEFVCRSCFLVRTRVLLADPKSMTCRDCST